MEQHTVYRNTPTPPPTPLSPAPPIQACYSQKQAHTHQPLQRSDEILVLSVRCWCFTLLQEFLCFVQVSLPGEAVQVRRHTSGFDAAQAYGTGHSVHRRHLHTALRRTSNHHLHHHTHLLTAAHLHTLPPPPRRLLYYRLQLNHLTT